MADEIDGFHVGSLCTLAIGRQADAFEHLAVFSDRIYPRQRKRGVVA